LSDAGSVVCSESGFLPKNRKKLQENHNVFSERLRESRFMKSSRNSEYGSRSKKGPDSQLLAFVTTNPESKRTKNEITIEPETSFEKQDVASRWITPPQNMP
jgi:hypothetical protein